MNFLSRKIRRTRTTKYGTRVIPFFKRLNRLKRGDFAFRNRFPVKASENIYSTPPFFIVGSGRSGNTLLRAVLATHENIVIPPEFYGFFEVVAEYLENRHLDWNGLKDIVWNRISGIKDFDYWGIEEVEVKKSWETLSMPQRGIDNMLYKLYECYASKQNEAGRIMGDKTPMNAYNLWWINTVFPRAKFIHIVRDGRDVSLSYVKSGLEKNLDDAGLRWKNSVRLISDFYNEIPANRTLVLRYEDLVSQTIETMEEVTAFLGLGQERVEHMVAEYRSTYSSMGDTTQLKHHKNVSQPITTKSIRKWAKELTPNEKNQLEKIFLKELKAFGYD